MNNCIGFPSGVIANSYTTQAGTSTTIGTTKTKSLISITLNQTDVHIQVEMEVYKYIYHEKLSILVLV